MTSRPSVLGLYDGQESGCNYYRLIMPYTALREYGWQFDWLPIGKKNKELAQPDWQPTPSGNLAPPHVIREHRDVMNFIRPMVTAVGEEELPLEAHAELTRMLIEQVHQGGAVACGDIDDDMWNVEAHNPWKDSAGEDAPQIMRNTMRELDYMTCTTPYLKKRIIEETGLAEERVLVVPNLMDFDLWDVSDAVFQDASGEEIHASYREVRRARLLEHQARPLVIGLQGGNSHQEDWKIAAPALKRIVGKYGARVRIIVAGYHPDYLKEVLQEATEEGIALWQPFVPFNEHPDTVLQFDINLCPLRDSVFNRSKSAIKWMEAACVGAVSVASPTVYGDYIVPGQTGLLARDEEEWFGALSFLIENREVRQSIGRRAHATVRTHFNLQTRAYEWVEAYMKMWLESQQRLKEANMTFLETQELAAISAAA